MSPSSKKVVLAIRSLDVGGAERYVIELANSLTSLNYHITVLTMYNGTLDTTLLPRVTLMNLHKKGRWDIFPFFLRLIRTLSHLKPDVVYAHQGEMNVFCTLARPFSYPYKLLWCLHQTFIDFSRYDTMSRIFFTLQRLLSSFPDKIVTVAEAGIAFYKKHGFHTTHMNIICNGIDTTHFAPDSEKRKAFRTHYGLLETHIVIGIAARLDPMKGYPILAKAAALLFARYPHLIVISVGKENPAILDECHALLGEYKKRFIWLGIQRDMVSFYNGCDIAVSPSLGEAFSLAIAEAAACGLPCVVSDVGDSAFIVEDSGLIVPPNDPLALAKALETVMKDTQRMKKGILARKRIETLFSLTANTHAVEALL